MHLESYAWVCFTVGGLFALVFVCISGDDTLVSLSVLFVIVCLSVCPSVCLSVCCKVLPSTRLLSPSTCPLSLHSGVAVAAKPAHGASMCSRCYDVIISILYCSIFLSTHLPTIPYHFLELLSQSSQLNLDWDIYVPLSLRV